MNEVKVNILCWWVLLLDMVNIRLRLRRRTTADLHLKCVVLFSIEASLKSGSALEDLRRYSQCNGILFSGHNTE
ncbi:hypothetical protein MKW92_021481 [Papaver armeniacum]|nr:hypothetical protein MKW92_021481 [Papaver armeniacum]